MAITEPHQINLDGRIIDPVFLERFRETLQQEKTTVESIQNEHQKIDDLLDGIDKVCSTDKSFWNLH